MVTFRQKCNGEKAMEKKEEAKPVCKRGTDHNMRTCCDSSVSVSGASLTLTLTLDFSFFFRTQMDTSPLPRPFTSYHLFLLTVNKHLVQTFVKRRSSSLT